MTWPSNQRGHNKSEVSDDREFLPDEFLSQACANNLSWLEGQPDSQVSGVD